MKPLSHRPQYLAWADQIRVTALMLVIILHASAAYITEWQTNPSSWWLWANLIDAFTRMAVPLFIMLSGALLLGKNRSGSNNESAIVFYRKRVLRVVAPWFFWASLGLVGNLVYQINTGKNPITFFADPVGLLYHTYITSYWYLALMMVVYICTPWLRWVVQTINDTKVYILTVILFWLACIITFFIEKSAALHFIQLAWLPVYFAYFLMGFLIRKKTLTIKNHARSTRTAVIIFILSWLATTAGTDFLTRSSGQLSLILYHYSFVTVIAQSLAAFWLFLHHWPVLAKWLSLHTWAKKFIIKTSQLSYGIFLLQFWVITWLQSLLTPWGKLTNLHPLLSIPLVTIIAFGICFTAINAIGSLHRKLSHHYQHRADHSHKH